MSVRTDYDVSVVLRRQERPYHSDSTASRLLSEVKQCRARLVLRWGTTLESLVLFFYFCLVWSANVFFGLGKLMEWKEPQSP